MNLYRTNGDSQQRVFDLIAQYNADEALERERVRRWIEMLECLLKKRRVRRETERRDHKVVDLPI